MSNMTQRLIQAGDSGRWWPLGWGPQPRDKPTLVPSSYPELEREVYRSVDDQTTVTPEPCELTELERDPVEVEVDAMFDEAAITAADLREGLAFRLSQRGE